MTKKENQDEQDVSLMALDQFFREMKPIPRLSVEEEQHYFARLARGRAEQAKPQPDQWRLSLAREARHRLAETYLPLVVHVARRYHLSCYRLELADLIQEGTLGLLRALDANDPADPRPFCSYAVVCIQSAIVNAIATGDYLIQPSQRFHGHVVEARRVERQLQLEQGTDPSLVEMAQVMHLEEGQLRQTLEMARRQEVRSLHELMEHGEEEVEEMMLAVMDSSEPESGVSLERQVLLRERLREATEGLSQRQRLILRWRYGLDEQLPAECSVQEIAQRLGCRQEAVRVARTRACRHLAQRLQLELGPEGIQCVMREDAVRVSPIPWYTQQEVARLLGCSREQVRQKVLAGELPTIRDARYRWPVYPKAAVDELVAAQQGQVA